MLILAIETSCDETAAAVVKYDRGCFDIISNIVASQVKIHSKYGGIVPEVAARNHVVNIIPVIDRALEKFKTSKIKRAEEIEKQRNKETRDANVINKKSSMAKKTAKKIDAIAVVNGPGLITSLLVGVETAKALAFAWNKPLIAVNHLEAHIYSAIAEKKQETRNKKQTFKFPALALIVSGGHTQLVLMKGHGKYEVVGETRDDAAGEAFDKVAKLLGLGYPGGPIISEWAEKILNPKSEILNKFKIQNLKFKTAIELPRPMIDSKDFDFSFSGLKTAVLYTLRELKTSNILHLTSYICAEFQQAVIDVLVAKTKRAAKKYEVKTVILCGGVSANRELRKQMAEAIKKEIPSSVFCLPSPGLSTDNAGMVGIAGVFHFLRENFTAIDKLGVDPNLNF